MSALLTGTRPKRVGRAIAVPRLLPTRYDDIELPPFRPQGGAFWPVGAPQLTARSDGLRAGADRLSGAGSEVEGRPLDHHPFEPPRVFPGLGRVHPPARTTSAFDQNGGLPGRAWMSGRQVA
jgi:hypothetical protein